MTVAIEPMICEKDYETVVDVDGWTVKTADGGLSAHFEHTIAITKGKPRILTLLEDGSEPYVPPKYE
jgi:methionyl aminopeptidase